MTRLAESVRGLDVGRFYSVELCQERQGLHAGSAGASALENLHEMYVGVGQDDAPIAVFGNAATRKAELNCALYALMVRTRLRSVLALHATFERTKRNNATCGI